MKEIGVVLSNILKSLILILIVFCLSCKKEPGEQMSLEMSPSLAAEIYIQQIERSIDVQFVILKTERVGFMPCHRFFWICLDKETSHQKIEDLAQAIVNEAIANNPKTYHSFIIHFFLKSKLGETVERSESYAQATYLPGGSWLEIRRTEVDNYNDYKLTCTFFD